MVLDILKSAEKALADELFSAMLYERIAMLYGCSTLKEKLVEMATMEREHAKFWRSFLQKRSRSGLPVKISRVKLAFYTVMLRIFGLGLTLRMLESGERDAVRLYSEMLEHSELDISEKDALRRILEDELIHEEELVEEESKFKGFLMHVRDAVLGMNDGLVEILSVTTGLAGAYGNPFYIAIGGLIVGAAGALSMGIGALASVRAQRQVHESALMRGFMIAISADLPVKRKMLEMVAFGLGSAGVTYVIGRIASILFGIEVG